MLMLMDLSRKRLHLALLWILPSGIEIALYIFLVAVTFAVSGMDVVRSLLFVSGDFNPIRLGVASIDVLLQRFVGEKIAGSLSLGIFWAIVGLIVNVLWWLGSNFSTELSNDLVFSKYVHPRDTNPRAQLREFIERTVIRTCVAIIAIIYINFFFSQGLPRVTANFAEVINNWSTYKDIKTILITSVAQIFMLHIFVVLTRLILLRKQIFDR